MFSEMKERICSWCGNKVTEWCSNCIITYQNKTDPKSKNEALEELKTIFDDNLICEIPFPMIHKRIETLMGRSVWSHELVERKLLIKELETGMDITQEEIISKVYSLKHEDDVIFMKEEEFD
jgi:hypothetical protein